MQGSGKSLAAKSVAGLFGVPLLRLDFGTLYNKYFGETERNLRNSLRQAELMAPCVLWLDEIEKGIATGDSDNATSKRVLATMLTWMAENKRPVFIVATSNDIAELPPELVRKGRMDEIFFVDLPDLRYAQGDLPDPPRETRSGSQTRSISISSPNTATDSPARKSKKRSCRHVICPHRIRRQ